MVRTYIRKTERQKWDVTDIQLENKECSPEKSTDSQLATASTMPTEPPKKKKKTQENSCNEPQPGCSMMQDSPGTHATSQPNSAFQTSPEALIPIPLIKQNTKRTSRKKGKTVIMTESPYKNELQESIALKAAKEEEKERKKREKSLTAAAKEKSVKKSLFTSSKFSFKPRKVGKKLNKKVEDSDSEEEDAECLYCRDFYSVSNEGWIACQKCFKWAHNKCAGVDSEDDEEILICEFCKQNK